MQQLIELVSRHALHRFRRRDQPFIHHVARDALDELAPETGIIFDGYPRTAAQAHSLDEILESRGRSLHHVIELGVNEDALVDRITGRFTCGSCGEGYHDDFKRPAQAGVCDKCDGTAFKRRADDKAETVRDRLTAYHAQTAPLIAHYEGHGVLQRVDAMESIAAIRAALAAIVTRVSA
jgi:adenylate kinase